MRRTVLLALWLTTDIALFIGAYIIAYFVRVGFIVSTDFPLDSYANTVILISSPWLLVMAGLGIFRLTRVQSDRKNLSHILFACVMASALFTLTYYFLYNAFFSRGLLVLAGGINLIFTIIWHLAFDQWQRRILRRNPPAYPVLIVGLTREAERVVKMLEERQSPLKPVAILDAAGSSTKEVAGVPVLGKLNKLEEAIKDFRPTHLLQCSNLEHSINLISACRSHNIKYMLLPSVLGGIGGNEAVIVVEGQPMIAIS